MPTLVASSFGFSLAQDPAPTAPVIDDATSELDVTIVTSSPATASSQTIRPATVSRPVEIDVYDTIEPEVITGGAAETFALPGSGYFVTSQEIREFNYTNPNRVFARVPGVYVREEDGSGLFPNLSIRGVDGTRNEKITVMEDGILQAPAPYSAPSAYYSPNIARMAGVEVLKGSSQIAYGPNTTGGVVNFLSTPIPESEQFYLRSTFGSNSTWQVHSHYGDSVESEAGTFGYLAELYYKASDGFRSIEPGLGIPGSSDSGYALIEPMIKLSWEPNSVVDQKFEFKYGYSEIDADESYLGLTDADFMADPYRRYAGSFLDNITSEQHRTYLKYSVSPTEDLDLRIAGYYNQFERDWFKIRNVNGSALHTVLGPGGSPADLRTLKGLAPGNLGYRHNARSYESYGAQFSGDFRFETGEIDHSLQVGVRQHEDNIRLFQENTDVVLAGRGLLPAVVDRGPGSGGNSYQESTATAVWIKDDIEVGRLTVTPGVRYESVDLHFTTFAPDATNTVTAVGNGDIDWFVSGVGLNYEIDEAHSIFGGVHEGIAIPGPTDSLAIPGVLPEESLGYELGLRHRSDNFNAELVGFLTDFSQIISTSAGLGLTGVPVTNAGTAEVHGVEALVSFDPLQGNDVRMPVFLSATWTSATLDQALVAGGGENIYGDGTGGPGIPGAEIPYVPEWKLAAGVGLETDVWGLELAATYVSDTFGTALNSPVPVTSSRQGEVDGGMIIDLGAFYRLNETTKLIGGVHNLFEEVMITSRIPEGARVNAPREFYIGFEMIWEPRPFSSGGNSVVSN
ncbi:MAG: TonB-dependent receptor [Verrucomicrobiae bacterium]|nr:TonB-dependent receptor [Verrucomicrobiae bacterium]